MFILRRLAGAVLILSLVAGAHIPAARAEVWDYKQELLPHLVAAVPKILADQETTSGRFGKGIWIVTDQNVIWPLAVAWSLEHPDNPYYHDPKVLAAIMDGGDALIDDQNERGEWMFRKKDGSTWGYIHMPWTYSRWVRAYGLIRDAMPPERRDRWEKALLLGYTAIEQEELAHIHNIPAHHAMGLYVAGRVLNRADWSTTAAAFLRRVARSQHPDGYWSENSGPVVGYNFVYTDALGTYYALSADKAVLPMLERSARLHAAFTYPDGSAVETIDERQVYRAGITMPNVGFTHTPEGRGYLRRQMELLRQKNLPISADMAASLIHYGSLGETEPAPPATGPRQYVTGDARAMVRREGPWFVALSAYTSPVSQSRWICDRQNLVSLYHDKTRLILGGGNTKLQPLWSTFTAGNPELLRHRPGDEDPDFTPPAGLIHVPTAARLETSVPALVLDYGDARCRVEVDLTHPSRARLVYSLESETTHPVKAHIPFMPAMGKAWKTAAGTSGTLSATSWRLGPGEAGSWFAHDGWRVSLPAGATVTWPVLPHNQYRKDGSATPAEGKIVVTLPFSGQVRRHEVMVEIPRTR